MSKTLSIAFIVTTLLLSHIKVAFQFISVTSLPKFNYFLTPLSSLLSHPFFC